MISVFHFPLYLPLASLQPSTSRSLYRNRSFLRIPLAARPRFSSLRSLRFVPSHSDTNKDMPPPFPQPSPQPMLSTCNSWIEKKEDQKGLWGLCGLYGMQKEVFIYLFFLYFFFLTHPKSCVILRQMVVCMQQCDLCLRTQNSWLDTLSTSKVWCCLCAPPISLSMSESHLNLAGCM